MDYEWLTPTTTGDLDYVPFRKGTEELEHLPHGFNEGEAGQCSYCGGYATYGRGLRYVGRTRDGVVRIPRLAGFRCRDCGETEWDPTSYDEIEAAKSEGQAPFGVRAKVSKLARNNIGVYIPNDIREYLALEAGDYVEFQPISPSLVVLDVIRATHENQDDLAGSTNRPKGSSEARRVETPTTLLSLSTFDIADDGIGFEGLALLETSDEIHDSGTGEQIKPTNESEIPRADSLDQPAGSFDIRSPSTVKSDKEDDNDA